MTEVAESVQPTIENKSDPISLGGLKSARTEEIKESQLTNSKEWFIMEGLPGNGDRPAWLPEKFKSLEAAVKSQSELEKMFGSRELPPEEYDFGENSKTIDTSNPVIQDFLSFAKQKNLTQEVVGTAVDSFVKYINSTKPDFSKEMEKLGPDGNVKIETIRKWAQNNFSQSSLDVLGRMEMTADAVNFLDELRQYHYHSQSQPPITNEMTTSFVRMNKKEIEDEMFKNMDRYNNDSRYREEITKKFEQAVG